MAKNKENPHPQVKGMGALANYATVLHYPFFMDYELQCIQTTHGTELFHSIVAQKGNVMT